MAKYKQMILKTESPSNADSITRNLSKRLSRQYTRTALPLPRRFVVLKESCADGRPFNNCVSRIHCHFTASVPNVRSAMKNAIIVVEGVQIPI